MQHNITNMAIAIRTIPTLKGKEAETFAKEADKAFKERRASIDYTQNVRRTRALLKKSKIL